MTHYNLQANRFFGWSKDQYVNVFFFFQSILTVTYKQSDRNLEYLVTALLYSDLTQASCKATDVISIAPAVF